MINFGKVRPGSTLRIPFESFAGSTGASITATGLAVGDIRIYKDGGTTERASTSGFTLLDTDGLDFDAVTGLHGFSIDLADNTTADFYASGSFYWVVVSTITVDSQTVSFIAATFEIGEPGSFLDTTIATLSTQTSFTLTTGPAEDNALNGLLVVIHDAASAVQRAVAVVSAYTGSTKTVTLAAAPTFTIAAKDNLSIMPCLWGLNPTVIGRTLDVSSGGEAGVDWANVGSPTTTVGLSGTTVKTATDVETDTADIQGRLPAALVGGRIDANMGAISTDVTAADNAEAFFDGTGYAGTNNVIPTVTTVTTTTNVTNAVTANVTQISGDTTAADNAEAFFDGTGYAGTGNTIPTVTTVTNAVTAGTVSDKTGYSLSAGAIQAIWDALTSALTTVGSIGKRLADYVDAAISSRGTGTALDAAGVRSAVGLASANLDTQLGAIDDYIDSEVAAIKAKTDNLPASPAATGDIPSAATVADAVWDELRSGHTTAGTFGAGVVTTYQVKKNTALAAFQFPMFDSADHVTLKTGLTITATRSIDGAAFAACANSAAEIGTTGVYKINLAAADLNGDTICLKFTATGADAQLVTVVTQT